LGELQLAKKNPAELPAGRSNSGAGTEKRPITDIHDANNVESEVKQKTEKKETN